MENNNNSESKFKIFIITKMSCINKEINKNIGYCSSSCKCHSTIIPILDNLCETFGMTRKIVFCDKFSYDINYEFNDKLYKNELREKFENFCTNVEDEFYEIFISARMMLLFDERYNSSISIDGIPKYISKPYRNDMKYLNLF